MGQEGLRRLSIDEAYQRLGDKLKSEEQRLAAEKTAGGMPEAVTTPEQAAYERFLGNSAVDGSETTEQ